VKSISSRQNPLVRTFRALADDPDPTGERLLLDGAHLVRDAHRRALYSKCWSWRLTAGHAGRGSNRSRGPRALGLDVIAADEKVFAALSPVKSPSGIAAIVRRKVTAPSLICEHPARSSSRVDVQDPGNVGALIRAAEAEAQRAFVCGTRRARSPGRRCAAAWAARCACPSSPA
jgi:tRNA G18 (ribose-2'-O)-methylase SpoU